MAINFAPAPGLTPAPGGSSPILPPAQSVGLSLSPKDMITMAASVGGAVLGAGAGSAVAIGLTTKVLSDLGVPPPVIGQVCKYASVFGAAGGAAAGASLAGGIASKICDNLGIS